MAKPVGGLLGNSDPQKPGKGGSKKSESKPIATQMMSEIKDPTATTTISIRITQGELDELTALADAIKGEFKGRRYNKNSLMRAAFNMVKGKSIKQLGNAIKELE